MASLMVIVFCSTIKLFQNEGAVNQNLKTFEKQTLIGFLKKISLKFI